MSRFLLSALTFAWAVGILHGETIEIGPEDDWFEILSGQSLRPGDEVVLSEGLYSDARLLRIEIRGTPDKPITIRGEAGKSVTFKRPDSKQNSFNLVGCQHLFFRDIEITGGSSGIRISGTDDFPAKFIRLENLHIHHVGGPAITANHPGNIYEALHFRRNHIHHTGGHGEAYYLGCNNDADGNTQGYIFDSLIEGNYIHDLDGPGISQGDGIEIKDGSYGNIVRDNVIHDTKYPGITLYGTDGKAPNIVERNAVWNTGDHGIQVAADAIVRNNVIRDTAGYGIYCRDHQSARVGNLRILHNTILGPRSIRIVESEEQRNDILIANNALGSDPRLPSSTDLEMQRNALGMTEIHPRLPYVGQDLRDEAVIDDFFGRGRSESRQAGAFVFNATGQPSWDFEEGFKPLP